MRLLVTESTVCGQSQMERKRMYTSLSVTQTMSKVSLRSRDTNSEMIVTPGALPAVCSTPPSYYLHEGNG